MFRFSEIKADPLYDALPLHIRHQLDPLFFVRAGNYLHQAVHEHCASDTEYNCPLHDLLIQCTENRM
jgi:hypothetical protein